MNDDADIGSVRRMPAVLLLGFAFFWFSVDGWMACDIGSISAFCVWYCCSSRWLVFDGSMCDIY